MSMQPILVTSHANARVKQLRAAFAGHARLSGGLVAIAVATQQPQVSAALLVPPVWNIQSALPANDNAALLLVAAGLQDPGNLGTLIRSAEAFGATAVLTTAGTVSEWNQKALRASAGSVFRVPVVAITASEIVALKSSGVRV